MDNFIGKYWSDKKIGSASLVEEKTCAGGDRVKLVFSDDSELIIPLEVANLVVTESQIDRNELRIKRLSPVLEKILLVLLESELTKDDMEHLINIQLPASINRSLDLAHKKLWGKESYDVTLFDIDKILCTKTD